MFVLVILSPWSPPLSVSVYHVCMYKSPLLRSRLQNMNAPPNVFFDNANALSLLQMASLVRTAVRFLIGEAYDKIKTNPDFLAELQDLRKSFIGRPNPI